MARKKFWRSRTQPDRGWAVGFNNIQLTPATQSTSGTVFDFADIDPEALTGVVEADKSDWFIKRVIFDMFATVGFANTTAGDVARIFQVGLFVMANENVEDVLAQDHRVFSGETFNLASRILRTYSQPVYAGGVLSYAFDPGTPTIARQWVTTDDSSTAGGFGVTAPFWGPSRLSDDFEVSNAGLRNNQSLVWLVSSSEAPGTSYDWDTGDSLNLTFNWRVLLQKRRA